MSKVLCSLQSPELPPSCETAFPFHMLFTAVGGWRAVFCCNQSHPIRLYKAVTHERWSNCFLNLQEVHFLLHLTWVYSWQDDVVMCIRWLRVCMPLKQFDMSKCGDTWTIGSLVPRSLLSLFLSESGRAMKNRKTREYSSHEWRQPHVGWDTAINMFPLNSGQVPYWSSTHCYSICT